MKDKEDNNVKKTYETPTAAKIAFNYREQVAAASGGILDDGNWIGGNLRLFIDGCNPQNITIILGVCTWLA